MKLAILAFTILASITAQASEGTRGGGSGCLAGFMRTAFETAQWLKTNGDRLSPVVHSADFLAAVDPHVIKQTAEDLRYFGNPVDAYYDGSQILIRCDRLKNDIHEDRVRVVAHEIFRKMHLEGDAYEMSRQIFASERGFLPGIQSVPGAALTLGSRQSVSQEESLISGVRLIGADLFVSEQSWVAGVPASLNAEAASFATGKSEMEAEERAFAACYTKFAFCKMENSGELSSNGMEPQSLAGRPDVQYRGRGSWQTAVRGSNSFTSFKKINRCSDSEVRKAERQMTASMPETLVKYVVGPHSVYPQSASKIPPYSMEYLHSAIDAAGGCTVISKAVRIDM